MVRENEGKLASGEKEIADNEQKLRDGEKEISENEQKLKDSRKDIKKAEKDLEEGKKEYEDGKRDAEKEITDGEKKIQDAQDEIDDISMPEWMVTDRNDLPEYSDYGDNADRMRSIGQVFPVIFFLNLFSGRLQLLLLSLHLFPSCINLCLGIGKCGLLLVQFCFLCIKLGQSALHLA